MKKRTNYLFKISRINDRNVSSCHTYEVLSHTNCSQMAHALTHTVNEMSYVRGYWTPSKQSSEREGTWIEHSLNDTGLPMSQIVCLELNSLLRNSTQILVIGSALVAHSLWPRMSVKPEMQFVYFPRTIRRGARRICKEEINTGIKTF